MSDSALRPAHASGPIFVVGADGMLGGRLVTACEQQGKSVWGSTRNHTKVEGKRLYLDLANDVHNFLLPFSGHGTAIFCAAHTSIAQCQLEPSATRRINVKNTLPLVRRLLDAGMFVVFLSSNAVFNGVTAFPRSGCGDNPNPQHEYGRQKADVEAQLLDWGGSNAVIRFTKIITPDMPLLSGWLRNLRVGEPVHLFSEAVMAPLSADFATHVICRVEIYRRAGVIQASASDDISYADAAKYLAATIAADTNLIRPVSCKRVGLSVFAKHTALDTAELKQLGPKAPSPTNVFHQFI